MWWNPIGISGNFFRAVYSIHSGDYCGIWKTKKFIEIKKFYTNLLLIYSLLREAKIDSSQRCILSALIGTFNFYTIELFQPTIIVRTMLEVYRSIFARDAMLECIQTMRMKFLIIVLR